MESSNSLTLSSEFADIKDVYKMEKTIGYGTASKVKRARHRETNELVAVKIIQKKQLSKKDLSYVHQEIEIAKMLDHPNIVKIIDAFEDEKCVYIVTELMQGGSIMQLVENGNEFKESEVRDTIMSIIDAV